MYTETIPCRCISFTLKYNFLNTVLYKPKHVFEMNNTDRYSWSHFKWQPSARVCQNLRSSYLRLVIEAKCSSSDHSLVAAMLTDGTPSIPSMQTTVAVLLKVREFQTPTRPLTKGSARHFNLHPSDCRNILIVAHYPSLSHKPRFDWLIDFIHIVTYVTLDLSILRNTEKKFTVLRIR
jgi:hypothetical protein